MDRNSLAYTKLECKCHIVFAPKYRHRVISGQIKSDLEKVLRELCDRKGIKIIEAECYTDHFYIFVLRIPPKYSMSQIMGYLKGKSSLKIFDRYANLKYKYDNRHFWCRGYYLDTVGKNAKTIVGYIPNQLQENITADQLTLKEYIDPVTAGEPVKQGKKK